MTPFAKLVGIGVAAILMQVLATQIFPNWLRPDLILIFALAMGLRVRGTSGLVLAFLLGAVVDILSGSPAGLFALLRGTACAVTRVMDRALYLRAAAPWALYVLGFVLVDGFALGLCQRMFSSAGALPWTEIALRLPASAVFTALLAAATQSMFLRLDVDATRDPGMPLLAGRGPRA